MAYRTNWALKALTSGCTGQISAVTFCAKIRTKSAIKNLLGEPGVMFGVRMNKKERKVLASLLATYRRESAPFYLRWPFRVAEFIVLVSFMVFAKFMLERTEGQSWLALITLVCAGSAIGFMSVLRSSHTYIPTIRPFLDLDGIENALERKE